jgi:hypothetical protein
LLAGVAKSSSSLAATSIGSFGASIVAPTVSIFNPNMSGLGDVSRCSSLVATEEAADGFVYSLPDLGLAGFGPPAAGSRHDHFRGNEIKELASTDSRIHFAQSSSCHLLIKVTSERGTHSLTTICAWALYKFGKALPFHHHKAVKGNGTRGEDAIKEQFPECSKAFSGVSWVSRTAESSAATILAPRITTALNESSFPWKSFGSSPRKSAKRTNALRN